MRLFPRSTSGLVLLVSLVVAAATLALGGIVYHTSHEALEQQLNHRIEAETHALLTLMDTGGTAAVAAGIGLREDGRLPTGMGYILTDPQGRRIAGRLNASVPEPGWREFLYTADVAGGRGVSQALTSRLPDGAALVVAADRTPIDEIDGTILRLFIGAFGTMLLVGIGGAWALGAVVRARLERINATARAIIAGELDRRMPRDGTSNEFDQLAETLNRMLDRNAALLENLQQVSSDIAHDLRTPLTRLQQALDGALREGSDADGYRTALESASERSREMLDLFAALLRISEVETFQVREAFRTLNLSEVAERCVDAFRPDVEASGRSLLAKIAPAVVVDGDRHLISQLLVNLIENAVRHTEPGAVIEVSLALADDTARLIVADDGPGIPASERERVLRRFARLERSRSTLGHGLGLSLAAAIARAHHGELVLADNAPGLRVSVQLRLARSLASRDGSEDWPAV